MSTWTLLDTETTGLYPPIHVIDVAAQKFEGLTPIGDPFQVYIDHNITIPPEATAVHGYTTDFISQNGIEPSAGYKQLRAYIGDDPVVAHYLMFDWNRVLIPELIRLREQPIGHRGFCSWLLSRRALPEHPTHKLDYLRDAHQLACSRPHSALGDVESVQDLLTRVIFPRLASIGYDTLEGVREFTALRPVLKCKCLIQGMDYEEEARKIAETRKEKRRLEKFTFEVECGEYPIPSLLLDHDLIDEDPSIEFVGKTFLFTGKMAWGTRPKATALINERGGSVSKSKAITKDIDYFVLGEDKEKGWTSLIHGGKLTKAFLKRFKEPHLKYRIVREEDFIAALQTETIEQVGAPNPLPAE
jgi:DNA polymerase III epsilon subunit-like protein